MLKDIIVNENIAAESDLKADAACVTGMAVVKDYPTGKFKLPTAITGTGLFFVQKERYPQGVNAGKTQVSDWDTSLNAVAAGELVPLYQYPAGSLFGTDQFDTTTVKAANAGKLVAAGTDGKLAVAANTVDSIYKFIKIVTEGTHSYALIEVLDTAKKNS